MPSPWTIHLHPSAVGSSERLKQHHRLGSVLSSEVRVQLLTARLLSSWFLGPTSLFVPTTLEVAAASYGYSLQYGLSTSPTCACPPSPLMEFSRLIYRVSLLFPDWTLTNRYLFTSFSLEGARSEQNHHRACKHRLLNAFLVEGNSALLCLSRRSPFPDSDSVSLEGKLMGQHPRCWLLITAEAGGSPGAMPSSTSPLPSVLIQTLFRV